MSAHPVQFRVEPSPIARVQVLIRVAILVALALVARGSLGFAVYIALPVLAALLASRDGSDGYLRSDSPKVLRVVRWFAGAYAYLWLLTDALPGHNPRGPVELVVEVGGKPTASSAMLRLLTSLPGLLLLTFLTIVAAVLWMLGLLIVLATGRMPAAIADFIAMKIRFELRLLAFHLSLVDAYPILGESPEPHAPHSGAA